MEFAANTMLTKPTVIFDPRFILIRLGVFITLLYLAACATEQGAIPKTQIRPATMTPAFESLQVLQKWYDNTYKTYYDVRGPVKEIRIKPMTQLAPVVQAGEAAEMERVLQFNSESRLQFSDERQGNQVIQTRYFYLADGRMDKVEMRVDDDLQQLVNYQYVNNALANTTIHDKTNNSVLHVRHQRVLRKHEHDIGWIDLSLPVEAIDVINANEFSGDGTLLWSSRGGFNNGLGLYYVIKTTDDIISSSVKWRGETDVITSGGYQYEHDDDGRLVTVISLGANNGGVYHASYYRYGEFGLLLSEQKQVSGKSLFNRAADEEVEYQYHELDRYGNWLSRSITRTTKYKTLRYHQHREINYY